MRKSVVGMGVVLCLGGILFLGVTKEVPRRSTAQTAATTSEISQHVSALPSLRQTKVAETPSLTKVSQAYSKLPLAFEPNVGQVNPGAKFVARGDGYAVFLTSREAVLLLKRGPAESAPGGHQPQSQTGTEAAAALRIQLTGANVAPRLTGVEELPGKSNYFIGKDQTKWRTNIPNFRKVIARQTYSGVDTVYYGTQRHLEYDFVVGPGADPRVIHLTMPGVEHLRIDGQGDLLVGVPRGEVRLHKPVAYQEASGARKDVAANYVLAGGNQVAFKVGSYNRARPLVIDPILSYSTYLGGSNIDGANSIAVAPDGTAFITGGTFSLDFPVVHPLQPNHGGPDDLSRDAFVSKISADGSALLYSTYLGGKNEDVGNGIAVDAFGDAYVIGTTFSPDFPVTPPGVLNSECGGDGQCGATFNPNKLIVSNAFVSKLNSAGSGLVYSTFFGEYENVRGQAIAVDANQLAYITGSTQQNFPVTVFPPPPPPPPFPITANAFRPSFGGGVADAFVAKISATGTTVEYSTYLGGTDEEIGYGIAVDGKANAHVTGLTYSADFPVLNAVQGAYGGAGDAFFSKISTDGSGTGPGPLLYSTYLGGSNFDQGNGIALDSNGIAYITGFVGASALPFSSTASLCGLPGAAGLLTVPAGTFCGGTADAFVAQIDASKASAASLLHFTNFGGSGADAGNGVAVDPSGNAYVTGSTVSTDFPTTTAVFQAKYGGGNADAFVTKLDPTGATPLYSSFLGGTNTDTANAIAVDTAGGAYVAGQTCSLDFPLANPVQAVPGGNCDAFVSKVSILNGIQLNPAGLVFPAQSLGTTSQPQTVKLTNGDNLLTISGIALTGANPGDYAEIPTPTACGGSLKPGEYCTITVTFTPTAAGIRKASVTITDNAPGSPQIINLNGQSSTLTLSASSLAFGNQQVGIASSPMAITATNNGTAAMTFSSITASGDFSETDDCIKAPLQPTTNCVINVTYKPSTAGPSIGSLTLTDNAPGSPQIVLLAGTGVVQQPLLVLSPSSLSFGNQQVGTTSSSLPVTATNKGTAPVTFSSVVASGAFADTDNCTKAPIQPGTNCVINVTFTPSTAGSSIGALTLTDNAVGSPQVVTLTGTGVGALSDFTLSALQSTYTIPAGQAATYTLEVSATGGFSQPIGLTCSGAVPKASCSISPDPVTPSASTATPVTVTIATALRTVVPPAFRIRVRPFDGLRYFGPRLACLIVLLMLANVARARKRPASAAFGFVAVLVLLLAACNSGNPSSVPAGTPAGTYQVVVTGTSGSLTRSITLNLQVN